MKDYFHYTGKTCVVTGASSGIGKATAEMLVEQNADVFALDRFPCSVPGIRKYILVDLNSKESIDQAFASLPSHIDKFFGAAGLSGLDTDYYVTFTVNYIANKYITETYLKQRMSSGGAIAYVTSTAGMKWKKYSWEYKKLIKADTWEKMQKFIHNKASRNDIGALSYFLSKRCLHYYAAQKACEMAKLGIRVNCLLPSESHVAVKEPAKTSEIDRRVVLNSALAKSFFFLNSDMASLVSGMEFVVDQGENAQKILKLKKDQHDIPLCLGIYNTKLARQMISKKLASEEI